MKYYYFRAANIRAFISWLAGRPEGDYHILIGGVFPGVNFIERLMHQLRSDRELAEWVALALLASRLCIVTTPDPDTESLPEGIELDAPPYEMMRA